MLFTLRNLISRALDQIFKRSLRLCFEWQRERIAFIQRQKSLLEKCYRGENSWDVDIQEQMLIDLVQHDHEKDSGLQSYLRNMMQVMEFDARRRGGSISQVELNEYTRWLATAVTDNLHHFIGHGEFAPRDETRYLAVSDALPGGFEPIEGWFQTTAPDLARVATVTGGGGDRDWLARLRRGGFDHVEKHDDRVLAFATRLGAGRHEFSYLVRATTAGQFLAPGTRAEEMYAPEVTGRAAAATVTVR